MANSIMKTMVATGCSSGLGFEAIKQLFTQTQSAHSLILGASDTKRTEQAFEEVKYDHAKHSLSILPLQLSDLESVQTFAKEVGERRIDCLLLNAATSMGTGSHGSKWSEANVVNVLSHHYLIHLLRARLVGRIVFVSSGAIRQVTDTSTLLDDMKDSSGLEECGANVRRAIEIEEFPADPERMFLTSWGEWWEKEVYALAWNQGLQDLFSPSLDDIKKEEGLQA